MRNETKTLAIIGTGPRGLSALESFLIEFSKYSHCNNLKFLIFEATDCIGCSPVYDTKQPESNWVNITERALSLEGRPDIDLGGYHLPAFPSYADWNGVHWEDLPLQKTDAFPARSKIGCYLNKRFQSLADALKKADKLTFINERADAIHLSDKQLKIKSSSGKTYNADEVLLTIGHQDTEPDEQLQNWKKYVAENTQVELFLDPYPIRQFFKKNTIQPTSVIALRGFGLAMVDVMRSITKALGGQFHVVDEKTRALRFEASESMPKCFVPFSLDGLPMSPKPLNAAIDGYFEPKSPQIADFGAKIAYKKAQAETADASLLIDAIAPIAASVFKNLKNARPTNARAETLAELCAAWLKDGNFEHDLILSKKHDAEHLLRQYIGMATDTALVSLDFCIGQVWRYCQPSIYDKLSHSACSDDAIAAIIALDERLKRYSFGPPVESLQQILALHEAGYLSLEVIENPEIKLTDKGWKLSVENHTITADTMINSVLDAPKLLEVTTPIIQNMLNDELMKPIHSKLGVLTDENGYLIAEKETLPIALLGRLAKGTIIGVDAILECFGQRPKAWAAESVQHFLEK